MVYRKRNAICTHCGSLADDRCVNALVVRQKLWGASPGVQAPHGQRSPLAERTVIAYISRQGLIACGQAAAYPQEQMCKTTFTGGKLFFLHQACTLDTILVQHFHGYLNC